MNKFNEIHERFIANIKKSNPKLGAMLEKQHIATMNRLNKSKAKAKAVKAESIKVEANADKTEQDTQD